MIAVMNVPMLRTWLGQAALEPIDTYEVGNIMKDIASYENNQKKIEDLVQLSQADPVKFGLTMGSDGDNFLALAADAEMKKSTVAQFEKDFVPVGSRNKISPDVYADVNKWLSDQSKLSELLDKNHDSVSGAISTGPEAAGLPSTLAIGSAVVGIGAILFVLLRKLF